MLIFRLFLKIEIRTYLFKGCRTSANMNNYQINRLKSTSREEISWCSIFDLSVSGKHNLYSGHNVGYIRNELVKFKDSFDLDALRNRNVEYEMTDGSKIELTLDDSTIRKIRDLDKMHELNYAMVMDPHVPDYDYTPSGIK